jgi:hypothetical protein
MHKIMRATGVMRFVILGAVGFGMGWAIAGFFATITAVQSPSMLPYFSYLLAGACGGAGLGLGLRNWKRVATLALMGALGFGLGLFPLFILGFIGLLSGWTSIAMGIGVVGGAALGLVFGDLKRVAILALAGVVGFGIGAVITEALRMPFALYPFEADFAELWQAPVLLLQHLLVQIMVGLIGGASLGAALGYLEIGIRPWRLVVLFLGFAILLVGAPLAVRGFSSASGVCTGEERKVYAEFPQYGNINKEPQGFPESGGCAVFYDTRASQERVAEYYAEQLRAHGWGVEKREYETTVSGAKKRTFEEVEITARRGDFSYNVLFESHEYYDPPRPGVHVAVHVFKSSKKASASCGSEEKAALAEFSHYGGKEVGEDLEASPLPGKARGACVTGYPARGASQEQVSTYYEEKLTGHGWEVEQSPEETQGSRDGLRYVVRYWRNPGSTEVEVQVFEG